MKDNDNNFCTEDQTLNMQRRQFIQRVSLVLASASLPGCLIYADTTQKLEWLSKNKKGKKQESSALEKFLHLSVLLTGFAELEKDHALLYLNSIQQNALQAQALDKLYEQSGYNSGQPPKTLEELNASGVFNNDAIRKVTDRITISWYTGIYNTATGPQLATHEHALCWHALQYATPPTVCGGKLGFWSTFPVT